MKKLSVCLLITFSLTTLSFASSRGGRRGPPPEAISACESKAENDTCSFEGRRGDTVSGVCFSRQEGELACKPKNKKRRRNRSESN